MVRRAAMRTQRRRWRQAAGDWDEHSGPNLASVIDTVIEEAGSGPLGFVVDVGAGTGALSLPLAGRAERVLALDISEAMLGRLEARAGELGLGNVKTCLCPIEEFDLEPASVDVVVSNYALHHLLDRDKVAFVRRVARWLRPGGVLVIGDMMFGRGSTAADRAIIASKVRTLIARGPSGWWRVAKNAARFTARMSERPVSMERWVQMLEEHGFDDLRTRRVVAEAAVVRARRP